MKFLKNFFGFFLCLLIGYIEKFTPYKFSMNLDIQSLLNNMYAYPQPGDNAVRKDNPYYDTQTVATGTTKYSFFNTDTGNLALRNVQFPLSGTSIFFVTAIHLLVQQGINTAALFTTLTDLLQHSYLEIVINNKKLYKFPGLSIVKFFNQRQLGATTPQNYATGLIGNKRKIFNPIIINSTEPVEVNFYIPTAAATALNGTNLKLVFEGIQTDKLDSFSVDFVKNYNFQVIDYDAYETQDIDTSASQYQIFTLNTLGDNNQSLRLPLSNIQRMQVNALQLFISGADASEEFLQLLYYDKQKMYLEVVIDNRIFLQSSIDSFLSVGALRDSTFADAGPVNTEYYNADFVFKNLVLRQPLIIPANGNVKITLYQPTTTLADGQPFTLNMQGLITQRLT